LAGDPKGEKPENMEARRFRVLSIFPGDCGGAMSRFVVIMVGVGDCRWVVEREGGKENN
jgi:hypothetical protein